MDKNFIKFLRLNSVKAYEQFLGIKLRWYQKVCINWWIEMKECNSKLKAETLYESILKGRF